MIWPTGLGARGAGLTRWLELVPGELQAAQGVDMRYVSHRVCCMETGH